MSLTNVSDAADVMGAATRLAAAGDQSPPAAAAAPDGSRAATDWTTVCALEDIIPDTGVCALVGGRQIAIVRVGAGEQVFAVDNFDPFSKAFVISRGIVGDKDGVPKIASPIFKQGFNLATGQCLEDPAVALRAYPARVRAGQVEVLVESCPIDPPTND